MIEHLRAGRPIIDCRLPAYVERGTIPGAVNIPHGEIVERIEESTVHFRRWCSATAPVHRDRTQAVDALLAAGWPAERLLYYRGGIHDWVTLGLPLAPPAS